MNVNEAEQGCSFEVHVSEEKLMFNIYPKAPLTYKATYVLRDRWR